MIQQQQTLIVSPYIELAAVVTTGEKNDGKQLQKLIEKSMRPVWKSIRIISM